jgi:hypothetical protein
MAAEIDRAWPFAMNLVLTLIACVLICVLWKERRTDLDDAAE